MIPRPIVALAGWEVRYHKGSLMFWELYQQRQIYRANSAAARAGHKADRVNFAIDQLEDKVDSLALVCQSMWELLSESIPDAERRLADRIAEVDLRDGKQDGKLGRVETHCPSCGRSLHKRHRRCLYCGEEVDSEHVFQ